MNELHLFAGAGGGILGGQLLGHTTICAVEFEPYAQAVLVARQNDGCFPPFPIWDDVRTFDGKPWRGIVDVVAGGFPCQDISAAGKGAGLAGERSGLWSEMARIIGEVRPRYAFIENSPMLVTRGLERVLCDLADLGYDARWCCLSAADCGAWHERNRIWILATDASNERIGWGQQPTEGDKKENAISNTNSAQCKRRGLPVRVHQEHPKPSIYSGWQAEPEICRVDDGVAFRSNRLKAIGNGQVSICAATAWKILMGEIS